MKAFNLIFCILFVLSAALQYNDPDPYIWMPIYLFGAVCCWMAFKGKFYPKLYIGGSVVFIAYAIYLFFEKNGVLDWLTEHRAENIAATMRASTPWIEDTREFFGLVLLLIAMVVNFVHAKRKRSGRLPV